MIRKLLAVAAALVVLSSAASAAADRLVFAPGEPLNVQIETPSTLESEGGTVVDLPADVHVLGDPEWQQLDAEVHRLQDAETRLTAERDSLLESARSPGWTWQAIVGVVVGTVAGMIIHWKAF